MTDGWKTAALTFFTFLPCSISVSALFNRKTYKD